MNRFHSQNHPSLGEYDSVAETFARSRKGKRWPEIDMILEEVRKRSPKRILDAGCGSGRLYAFLRESGYAGGYLGIDASENLVKIAQKDHPEGDFIHADMRSFQETSDTFDMIVALASLHHLLTPEDQWKAICRFHELLRPEGVLILVNWNLLFSENRNKYAPSGTNEKVYPVKLGTSMRHYYAFTGEEIESLLDRNGFQVFRISPPSPRNIVTGAFCLKGKIFGKECRRGLSEEGKNPG